MVSISNTCHDFLVEASLSELFEKYYRKGEQGNVPGTGIGLYFARQLIEAHAGALTVSLIKPGIIKFCIELPLAITLKKVSNHDHKSALPDPWPSD